MVLHLLLILSMIIFCEKRLLEFSLMLNKLNWVKVNLMVQQDWEVRRQQEVVMVDYLMVIAMVVFFFIQNNSP